MRQEDLARLLVKIAGLIIVIYALIGLPQTMVFVIGAIGSARTGGLPSFGEAVALPQFWAMSFAPFAIHLAIGFSLWRWAGPIVDRALVRRENGGAAADLRAIEEIAVAVIGFYFLGEGLADAARWVGVEFADAARNHRPFGGYILSAQFGIVVASAMRLVIGVALIFGSRGIVTLRRSLGRLRGIGVE